MNIDGTAYVMKIMAALLGRRAVARSVGNVRDMSLVEPFRFAPYDETRDIANIVVDGSPNASTVLTLTHGPGIEQPTGLAADLSAEMVFNYLDAPPMHPAAALVTNNHFDQDGLVGLHTLISPEISLQHRDQLIDVAAAGDFATYRFRDTQHISLRRGIGNQPVGHFDRLRPRFRRR